MVRKIYHQVRISWYQGKWELICCVSPRNVPEKELWPIFHFLARAALVMQHGSEDFSKPRYMAADSELCHFDLKLGNGQLSRRISDF